MFVTIGNVSKYFGDLSEGDTVEMQGPIKKFPYKPNQFRNITMLAGGSGIAPMTQLLYKILDGADDDTQVTLIFANKTVDDILLRQELLETAQNSNGQCTVHFVVEKPPTEEEVAEAGLQVRTGFIDGELLQEVGL